MEQLTSFLDLEIFHYKDHSLTVREVGLVVLIFVVTKLISIVLKVLINLYHKIIGSKESHGRPFYQLAMYFLWIIAITYMLEAIGIEITLILAGSAALLVGIGLGLQQTFNDILSGLVLLFERSVRENSVI